MGYIFGEWPRICSPSKTTCYYESLFNVVFCQQYNILPYFKTLLFIYLYYYLKISPHFFQGFVLSPENNCQIGWIMSKLLKKSQAIELFKKVNQK